jgi:hypothetical protein
MIDSHLFPGRFSAVRGLKLNSAGAKAPTGAIVTFVLTRGKY